MIRVMITLTTFLLPLLPAVVALGTPAVLHPHHPKAIRIGGAAGSVNITYFTVPYNETHLANLQPGFSWHLGFSTWKTDVQLQCGEVTIPAGEYKLDAVHAEDGWHFELSNLELAMAKMRARFTRGERAEAAQQRLAELVTELADSGGTETYRLHADSFKADDEEHLAMYAIHRGYNTTQRMSETPASGAEFSLRISFGDLHREVSVTEVFVPPADEGGR